MKIISNNKKAYHDYFVKETFECGIVLCGTEVKSLRAGKCSIKEAFVKILDGEAFIINMNISPYEHGNIFNRDPIRDRKLLLHKRELIKLASEIKLKGYTLVPLKIYFSKNLVKVEIGLCVGKKLYDKRHDIAKKDQEREARRDFKIQNFRG